MLVLVPACSTLWSWSLRASVRFLSSTQASCWSRWCASSAHLHLPTDSNCIFLDPGNDAQQCATIHQRPRKHAKQTNTSGQHAVPNVVTCTCCYLPVSGGDKVAKNLAHCARRALQSEQQEVHGAAAAGHTTANPRRKRVCCKVHRCCSEGA